MRVEIEFAANGVILKVIRPEEGKSAESTEVLVFEELLDLGRAINTLWFENNLEKALTTD